MKSVMRIISRYVLSAAGIALMLLIINFVILIIWGAQSSKEAWKNGSVSQLAEGLSISNGSYLLSEKAQIAIEEKYSWAMLLDDDGNVKWSLKLPNELNHHYTTYEVAAFSHWYLEDYPVYVWQHSGGLFVLGAAKGSAWKHDIEMPQNLMDNTLVYITVALILDCVAALLFASLLGLRLFRSLEPLAKGIKDLADNRPVKIPEQGLLSDLATGINMASEKLVKQENALNKRDNARTVWIAGVSHDIRTPLSVVMGYASQFENDQQLPQDKREQAGIIRKQSEKIKSLVNDLNLASKLEYDMQPLRKSTVSIAALLREVTADFLNSGIPERYILELEIDTNAQNMQATADEELLKRAISNLISNSISHNDNGCSVEVSLGRKSDACVVSVRDNGKGYPNEVLETLKNPHEAAELHNHGLGLLIVRQIIKAHGGTSEFSNNSQGGCVAVLTIPC
ncbi:MAG: HAMP domain-containing sensor histidine kinase [Oscillospiraceae bacterium]|nr:HAMP domain-containing sensor histidine kinase [Oscillospiraceae bacterium]